MDRPLKIKQWDPSKPKRKPNLRATIRNPELRPVLSDASFAQSIACDAENPWPSVGGEDLTNVDPYAGFQSIEEIIDEVIRSAASDSARDSIDPPNPPPLSGLEKNERKWGYKIQDSAIVIEEDKGITMVSPTHAATPKAISNSVSPYPGDETAGDSVKTLSLQNDTPKRGSNSQDIAIPMEKDKEQGICEMSPKHTIAPVATLDSILGRQVDLDDLAGGMPTASKNVVPFNVPLPLVLGDEEPDHDPQAALSVLAPPPPAATEVENHSPQEEHSDSTEHGDTLEADHYGDIVESTPTESGFGYASPYPTDTSLSSGPTTPSTPPSPSLPSKDETLQNPIQAQAEGTSGQSRLVPMVMDLNQHASSTQELEVCSSGKQLVDDMIGGRGRCGDDVEPCSTGSGGSRAPTPRRRARGSYILHGDYYESDDGDDDDGNDERGQQSPELDGADRSKRCSGSVRIEALLDDAKYRPAQSADSERDHDGDEDEDEAYGERRRKRHRFHEPLASIKRRRYGHTTRQRPTNTTRSVPSDRTPAPRMLSPSSLYTTSDDSDTGHDFATFQEWQLDNVILKRVVLNGVATFRLQFGWDMCSKHDNAGDTVHDKRRRTFAGSTGRVHRGERAKAKFTPEENKFLLDLKEGEDGQSSPHLTWSEIHRRFNARFPGRRSCGSLQVHYCTKLKGREES